MVFAHLPTRNRRFRVMLPGRRDCTRGPIVGALLVSTTCCTLEHRQKGGEHDAEGGKRKHSLKMRVRMEATVLLYLKAMMRNEGLIDTEV